jgi:hypothetical protein
MLNYSNKYIIFAIFILILAITFFSVAFINLTFYSNFYNNVFNTFGELSFEEYQLASKLLDFLKILPLRLQYTNTVYGVYIDYFRDCYIISDPYTAFFLTSITRCKTYFSPVFVVKSEYTDEDIKNMQLMREYLLKLINNQSSLNEIKKNFSTIIIVFSNRTAYYLYNRNCYFVFLSRSPFIYAEGGCYMKTPAPIPNNATFIFNYYSFSVISYSGKYYVFYKIFDG